MSGLARPWLGWRRCHGCSAAGHSNNAAVPGSGPGMRGHQGLVRADGETRPNQEAGGLQPAKKSRFGPGMNV